MKQQVINGKTYSIYAHDAIISDLTTDVENLTAQLNTIESDINNLISTTSPATLFGANSTGSRIC